MHIGKQAVFPIIHCLRASLCRITFRCFSFTSLTLCVHSCFVKSCMLLHCISILVSYVLVFDSLSVFLDLSAYKIPGLFRPIAFFLVYNC